MSVSTYAITDVRSMLFALKDVKPETLIVYSSESASGPVTLELHWAGKPSNAHFIRIGEARDE